jgi:hypothetical protein
MPSAFHPRDNDTISVAMRVHNPDRSPSQSMADTQPKLEPALLSLSAMISQDFTAAPYPTRHASQTLPHFPERAGAQDIPGSPDRWLVWGKTVVTWNK